VSKAGEKLLAAANEAVAVAKCEHDLMEMPNHLSPSGFSRTFCKKCGASFYEPVDFSQITPLAWS
jgi:hypothetical protein